MEPPNLHPMKGLFVTKFESKANCQIQNNKKKVLNFGCYSLFGVSLNLECFLVQYILRWLTPCFLTRILQWMAPILLSYFLYGNSQTRKQKDKKLPKTKNEMKAKPIEFNKTNFQGLLNI